MKLGQVTTTRTTTHCTQFHTPIVGSRRVKKAKCRVVRAGKKCRPVSGKTTLGNPGPGHHLCSHPCTHPCTLRDKHCFAIGNTVVSPACFAVVHRKKSTAFLLGLASSVTTRYNLRSGEGNEEKVAHIEDKCSNTIALCQNEPNESAYK